MSYTPGEWHLTWDAKGNPIAVVGSQAIHIEPRKTPGGSVSRPSIEEAEANARLIAAAPELLAACSAAEEWLQKLYEALPDSLRNEWADTDGCPRFQLRSAIAKATGK